MERNLTDQSMSVEKDMYKFCNRKILANFHILGLTFFIAFSVSLDERSVLATSR